MFYYFRDLWKPDSYFYHQDTYKEVVALIDSLTDERFFIMNKGHLNLQLQYSQKVKVTVGCEMNFEYFPFDTQNCKFLLKSLRNQPNLRWKGQKLKLNTLTHPDFKIYIRRLRESDDSYTGFMFILHRKPQLYVYSYFIPSTLLVITSWISFSIKPEVVPGRLGLLLTILLMLINLNNAVATTIPRSDGLCPLTSWIFVSIIFVAIALTEYFWILTTLKFHNPDKVEDMKKDDVGENILKMDKKALFILPSLYFLFLFFYFLDYANEVDQF